MKFRARAACSSAFRMISCVTPVILMSICSAVMRVARAGDLEVHVAEVVLGTLDVGEDDVVVALLDEAHRDAGDRRLDRRQRPSGPASSRRPSPSTTSRSTRASRDDPDRVRELLGRRDHGLERPLRERPWPMSRRFGPRMKPVSDRVGREVVVVHEAAVGLEREVVDPLALLGGAEGEERHDRVWPRVKSADPCVRGLTRTSHSIGRISSAPRPSGRRLSMAIFLRTRSL